MATRLSVSLISGLTLSLVGGSVVAQTASDPVDQRRDWTIYVNDDPKQCWVVSPPMPGKTTATLNGQTVSPNRGDIYLFVSFWPSPNNVNLIGEVSFIGGYDFHDDHMVEMKIDDKPAFSLFTEGEVAWSTSQADDVQISSAMKAGVEAVITGVSQRTGTITKDTFSLRGFTAAHDDAWTRCNS